MAHERRNPEAPWLTAASVHILESWLRPEDRGLEWGSGRSTPWIAKRVKALISIEHDETWYRRVLSQMSEHRVENVDYRYRPDEPSYLETTRDISAGSLDFVLVDGIARDHCVLIAVDCLRPGGLLIVDNGNWYLPCDSRAPGSRRAVGGAASALWAKFLMGTHGWRRIWTTNGVTDTVLFVKPGLPE